MLKVTRKKGKFLTTPSYEHTVLSLSPSRYFLANTTKRMIAVVAGYPCAKTDDFFLPS